MNESHQPAGFQDDAPLQDALANPRQNTADLHSIEAGQELLCAIQIQRQALDYVDDVVTPDDFYKPVHGYLFARLTEIRNDCAAWSRRLDAYLHDKAQQRAIPISAIKRRRR
jgi:replicative DNA helicase